MKSKNYRKVVFCLFVALQAGSFAFAANKKNVTMPEWVSAPASVYPNNKYLHYVGYASDRAKAEVQAINGLAAIFSQSVKSDSTASQRMTQAKSEGKVATATVSSFNQDVLRSVNVDDLIGVEIKEFWFDGDESGKIAAAFMDSISALGFRGVLDATERYLLTGKVSFDESVASDKKTTRCRYSLESFILDTENDQQLSPYTVSGREGHVSYVEAKNRAMKSLEKKIKNDFSKQFADYLKSM